MPVKRLKIIRGISVIVLFFFTWTFGGVFDIAYALNSAIEQKSNSAGVKKQSQTQAQKPEEKFQKAIEDIEGILSDTITNVDTKKAKVKAKRAEIESLDGEIKKEFSDTEKKLEDAGLPLEILDRHHKFVKHYDDNLNELKANLDEIDKARTKTDVDAAIEKAKAHLEKVRPPKKHRPLDPDKLPHRAAEPVFKEPRTKPEEFLQDARQSVAKHQTSRPILVASAGSLNGLLSSNPENATQTYLQIAQATNPPSASDLAETIEVQFTPEIRAKAQELGNNPVKIFNWVRNNIEYVPTYGSIQGANMCLQTKLCNDFDTASLLIALLRTSGIHAKYVYGTIELPIEKVKNWLGGFTDSMAALSLMASGGIPVKGMTVGGEIKFIRFEHVWVEAWVDMIPSQGAIHKQGDTWIPLDASYKQYSYTQGIDIKSAVPFDAQSFIDQIKSSATINEAEGYVTNVSALLVQQTMTDYQTRVQNYLSQNYPNATVGDVLGKKEIIKQEFPVLMGTLPYKRIVTGVKYTELPETYRHKLSVTVTKDIYDEYTGTPINITKSLPELAGKKITLSYSPATSQDEAVLNSYLPNPHPDGSPIQPNELPSSLPSYLINLKPELRIDGVLIATGTSIGMGVNETFVMTFSGPGANAHDVITNVVKGGNYLGIALDLGRVSQEQLTALKTKLELTKAKLATQDFTGLTKDDILGDLFYTAALSYHAEVNMMKQITANTMDVVAITLPSETIFSCELKSNFAFGIPISVSPGGLAMDADRLMMMVKSFDGNKEKPMQFMLNSGSNSSALEHSVPEQLFSTPDNPAQSVSAVKALQLANDQGIPIYTINQSNINTVFPQLQLDADVKADIQNAVNAGKEVTVSKTDITISGWTGCGYIIIDPVTGAGAYMISGGTSGGVILLVIGALLMVIGLFFIEVGIGALIFYLGWVLFVIGLAYTTDGLKNEVMDCVAAVVISLTSIFSFLFLAPEPPFNFVAKRVLSLLVGSSVNRIGRECFGIGIAY